MKKFLTYIFLFIIFYFQISLQHPSTVNADNTGDVLSGSVIIPESTPILTGSLIVPEGNLEPQTPIPPEISQENQNNNHENDETQNTPIEIETYFVVSAYYSPLPGQEHYLRGNYEDEVILNGRGVKGSSGKSVFAGMLAAPKTYTFGTKIYLEGLGVGEVSDRGGAIVAASGADSRGYAYDRIDVWMGYGEEGLKRALTWGKKTVKGKVLLYPETPVSIDLASLPALDSSVKNLVAKPYIDKSNVPAVFSKNITPESGSAEIKELQQVFLDMGMYESGSIDGNYENIKNTLIDYQIKVGIIQSRTQDGAGYFGPKTSAQLLKEYILVQQTRRQIETQKKKIEAELSMIKLKVRTTIDKFINNIGSPKQGDTGVGVRNLQKTLKALGHLKVKDSAIYGIKTKEALVNYQVAKGIISGKNDPAAGVFGPKTKEKMKQELLEVMEVKYLQAKKLISYTK